MIPHDTLCAAERRDHSRGPTVLLSPLGFMSSQQGAAEQM